MKSLLLSASLRKALILFVFFLSISASAQNFTLQGTIRDANSGEALIGVNVIVKHLRDSAKSYGTSSDLAGQFTLNNLEKGMYRLELSYVGYQSKQVPIRMFQDQRLDTLTLWEDTKLLNEAIVKEEVTPVQQNGDTTEYNADAFKTNPDADGTDLVKKMPGITTKDGKLQAQGEEVKKVTVDGQEFFGDDAMLALKNLPAEIIQKVQVFDKLSDQSAFTGFNDGNTTKTINIVTKSGKADGQFGKAYAGYGTDNRYSTGFNANYFNGKRRVTLIGMSNNINQQNFSNDDLLGALSVPSNGNRRHRRGPQTSTDPSDFLVGEQGGVNTAHSFGINYIDQWGAKLKVNASYFVNGLNNSTIQTIQRSYYLNEANDQTYDETYSSNSSNINHRFNLRMEYTIDSNNSIIYTPLFSFQGNLAGSNLYGINRLGIQPLNSTLNSTFYEQSGFNYSHELLFRHKFKKEGRTISLGMDRNFSSSNGRKSLYAENVLFNTGTDSLNTLDQLGQPAGVSSKMGVELMYTEPLGKKGQLTFRYSPSISRSNDSTDTRSLDPITGLYSTYDTLLSSHLDNNTITQRAGVGIRFRFEKLMFFAMVNGQMSNLKAEQEIPTAFSVNRDYQAILPFAFMRYQFSKNEQLRLFYRTSTDLPNGYQLQSAIDNSNPLLLSTGNEELNQTYSHRLGLRYNRANVKKGRTLFASLTINYANNYIATSSYIAGVDTVLNGVSLSRGTQLNKPVNLDNQWNASFFTSYGLPIKWLKSNLNLNVGISRSNTPGLINNVVNFTEATSYDLSAVLSSNISENVDFTLSYAADWNSVRNSFQPQLNNDYLLHAGTAGITWMPKGKWVINTQASYTSYEGLGDAFTSNYMIWNAAFGYKFLKNNAGDIRASVFDILGQNNSLTRNVSEVYVEDVQNQVLQRYVMLTFTYTFRNFNARASR